MPDVPSVTLNNGIVMPQLGLGVYKAADGEEVEQAVSAALKAGYRLIDTAAIYRNETGVGNAIKAADIPREELFITTKLWNSEQGYDSTLKAFDASMEKLGLDYLDLYLIHWPMPAVGKFLETWRAFEKLYADKRIRALGVSNFMPDHLQELLDNSTMAPTVNQIELHPYLVQADTRAFCERHDIKIESWSPIARGRVLAEPAVTERAEQYGKTPAQVVLRWHIQHGFIVIPKSVHEERIRENIDVFDFELSDEDMSALDGLHNDTRIGSHPHDVNS